MGRMAIGMVNQGSRPSISMVGLALDVLGMTGVIRTETVSPTAWTATSTETVWATGLTAAPGTRVTDKQVVRQ